MLKLRRAIVVETRRAQDGAKSAMRERAGANGDASAAAGESEQRLIIELSGEGGARREAIADVGLVGHTQVNDEVIVNTQALDLGLGSGGFDIVHVNLTRGLAGDGPEATNVMKLNYTSLQHTVAPVEATDGHTLALPVERPVAVLALHGQLASLAWAFAQGAPDARLGYVQTEGGALPGGHSHTVSMLRERGLLAGHLTAGAAFGGEGEAISTAGALNHCLSVLGWDAAVCGPGPGMIGSSSMLGHGGMSALDSAHVALALGCPTLLVARMSSSDERSRHRGISHHSLTVLDLLLEPVTVALPAGTRSPVGADLRAGLQSVFGAGVPTQPAGEQQALALEIERPTTDRPARIARHDWRRSRVDLAAYAASGLPTTTMGRRLVDDPLFFGAALAGGSVLAELAVQASPASA
jgi:Protein of unknown function (DUF3866)